MDGTELAQAATDVDPSKERRPATLGMVKDLLRITLPVAALCLLVAEAFFRTIIPAAEPPKGCFDEQELLYKMCPNQGEGTMTFGKWASVRAKWRINNHGWNSEIDYHSGKDRPRIAIIGDSYVEALQVDVDKNVAAVLRDQLGDRYDVYSFGASGYPLSQYLHVSRYAARHFSPDIFIFIIVHNDFHESLLELNPTDYHLLTLTVADTSVIENPPRPVYSLRQYNWKRQVLYHSRLVRYVLFNLRVRQAFLPRKETPAYNANIDARAVQERRETVERATAYAIDRIRSENPDKRIIFVMDAPRQDIYSGQIRHSNVLFLHSMLGGFCEAAGIGLLDLTEPMAQDYESNHRRFESDFDAHWNQYAHGFVAEQVLRVLERR